uniref:Uncharacterized protein n=1 Tax=Utricularia reniformis TaxID=192314 RepID=A0A1Y0B258_9LAMI|nr:hypothetical protein AEK19_MT1267 [Utricularia reniformis]ART31474.1 hypothetical protein AEK19_MT1267 [Utricularia reniformis]
MTLLSFLWNEFTSVLINSQRRNGCSDHTKVFRRIGAGRGLTICSFALSRLLTSLQNSVHMFKGR